MAKQFEVEVVFALPQVQHLRRIVVNEGCTAAHAVAATDLMAVWGQGSLPRMACFGRLITPETVLAANDRVEMLMPLYADPKDQRRQRVKDAKKTSARARSKS